MLGIAALLAAFQSCVYLFIQTCPLDLYTDSFYANRREVIEDRLQQLHTASSETLAKLVADIWTTQEGKAAALVSWARFSSLQQAQVSDWCPEWALFGLACPYSIYGHGMLSSY